MMITPPMLRAGDTVAAISLSWGGPGAVPERYRKGKRQLEEVFGLRVVETRHALRDPAWIAANPQARADDLMEALADPSIDGIISTIGGDDSIRVLPYIDLDVIRSNPKVFMGYSDTTVTHLAFHRAGVVSFYGPSIMAAFAENGGMLPYMVNAMRRSVMSAEPIGIVEPNRDGWTAEFLDWSDETASARRRVMLPSSGPRYLRGEGSCEGRLIGGCLEVLDWLRGTDVWPERAEWEGAILFIETSEEAPAPHVVKRVLRTFGAIGMLERLAGMIVGRPGMNIPPEQVASYDLDTIDRLVTAYDRAILDVVVDELGLEHLPIVTNMDFGHTEPIFILPYGVRACIDCEKKEFAIVEKSVSGE